MTAYTKPVHPLVGKRINEWESIRPSQQLRMLDRKTSEAVSYLFAYRGKPISKTYVNHCLIPLLCRKARGLRTNVSTCQPLRRWRAVGSSSILASLRLGGCAEMPVSARCVEQAIPPLTGVGRLAERERAEEKDALNAGPRSLSAHSARPPQSRAGSPTHLAGRTAMVLLVNHSQGQKTAQIAHLSR